MAKKYLTFEEQPRGRSGLTRRWNVDNIEGERVGHVHFHAPWRRYVFTAAHHLLMFDATCMREIVQFLDEQTQAQRSDAEARREAARAS